MSHKLPLQDKNHSKHSSSAINTLGVPEVILGVSWYGGQVEIGAVIVDNFLDNPGEAVVPTLDPEYCFVHWFLKTSVANR